MEKSEGERERVEGVTKDVGERRTEEKKERKNV